MLIGELRLDDNIEIEKKQADKFKWIEVVHNLIMVTAWRWGEKSFF